MRLKITRVHAFVKGVVSRLDPHMHELLRGASVAFLVKAIGALASFLFYVAIARTLGAEQSGRFFLVLTVVTVVAVISRLGMDNVVLRSVASHRAAEEWSWVRGVFTRAALIVAIASFSAAMAIYFSAGVLAHTTFKDDALTEIIKGMAWAIPLFAFFMLAAQALQGLKRIAVANFVATAGVPILATPAALALTPTFGVMGAVASFVGSTIVVCLFAIWQWNAGIASHRLDSPNSDFKDMFARSWPLFWATLFQLAILWSSTIMLGTWSPSDEVGIFSSANRTATLVSFILISVNSIAAPQFAGFYKKRDMWTLAKISRNAAAIMAILATPVVLILLVAPDWIMGIFGGEFVRGENVLRVLAVGQYINVIAGSVGYILIMCGREKIMRNIFALCAGINVTLNFALIPSFGMLGAAISSAVTIVLQNILASLMVYRELGFVPFPFMITRR